MSFRCIMPVFLLSISSFLCGSESNASGSPIVPGNASFSSICCFDSRQGSFVGEEPRTPLGAIDPNKPKSSTATPSSSPQSEFLTLLSHVFDVHDQAGEENFQNLSEIQRVGLQFKNQKIEETIYSMIINDTALAAVNMSARASIAKKMILHIRDRLTNAPQIWNNMPQDLKQQIIAVSTMVYTQENSFSRVLEDRITLEKFASFAELEKMYKNIGQQKSSRFAADEESPLDPDALIAILKTIAVEKTGLIGRPSGFHRYDSF